MMVPGKTVDKITGEPKKIKRDVINAMSEKLTSSYLWKWSFKERRCLIPMSSWDEWPETGAGKQRVRVSMPSEPVFMAAGLFDENLNPKTGEKVSVFTMCTVPPNEFLGTVHDRAPTTMIRMHFPAVSPDAKPVESASTAGPHPFRGKILLVEDNAEVAQVTEQLLQTSGLEVVCAKDAENALARLSAEPQPFDLLFSDISMPGSMDGIQLALAVRQFWPSLPIILTTGYAEKIHEAVTEQLPVVAKPVNPEQLLSEIHTALATRSGAF